MATRRERRRYSNRLIKNAKSRAKPCQMMHTETPTYVVQSSRSSTRRWSSLREKEERERESRKHKHRRMMLMYYGVCSRKSGSRKPKRRSWRTVCVCEWCVFPSSRGTPKEEPRREEGEHYAVAENRFGFDALRGCVLLLARER